MEHIRQGGLGTVKHAVQVHPHHLPPAGLGDVGKQLLAGDAGVADQHVDPAELPEKCGGHGLHLLPLGHVADVDLDRHAQGGQFFCQGLGLVLGLAADDTHAIALSGE